MTWATFIGAANTASTAKRTARAQAELNRRTKPHGFAGQALGVNPFTTLNSGGDVVGIRIGGKTCGHCGGNTQNLTNCHNCGASV